MSMAHWPNRLNALSKVGNKRDTPVVVTGNWRANTRLFAHGGEMLARYR
jgi:hypothetical protein